MLFDSVWRLLLCSEPQLNPTCLLTESSSSITANGLLFLFSATLAGATLKVTQMLQHFEHMAPVFVEAVCVWVKDYGIKSVVGELLR